MRDTTKDSLKQLKDDYKNTTSAIKKQYKEDRAAILSADKPQVIEPKEPFGKRVEKTLDNATLRICEPFEKKAQDIRWKQESPVEYDAYHALRWCEKLVGKMKKHTEKGKKLSARQCKKLTNVLSICDYILAKEQASSQHQLAMQLMDRASSLLVTTPQEQALVDSMQQMVSQLSQLTKTPALN